MFLETKIVTNKTETQLFDKDGSPYVQLMTQP
jgi:hypothetical protein